MPGQTWKVTCRGCGAKSEVWDGVGRARDGSLFGFAQYGCADCGRVESLREDADDPTSADTVTPRSCSACGGELTPWAGVVGHHGERPSADHGWVNERLIAQGREPIKELVCQGPCPRCGTAITARRNSLWD